MRTLVICESVHHGNTQKVAVEMSRVLGAELARPGDVSAGDLAGYGLIGFGSGIYAWRHHGDLLAFADSLSAARARARAFVFSTRGAPVRWGAHRALRRRLLEKGFEIVGEFSCLGLDTVGPLKWIRGLNRGRPDGRDLKRARDFARVQVLRAAEQAP